MIVFVYVSALGPRAAAHSRPALLPKHGLTPSLVLALLSCQNAFIPLARDYDIYWKVHLSLEYQINFFLVQANVANKWLESHFEVYLLNTSQEGPLGMLGTVQSNKIRVLSISFFFFKF